MRVLKRLLIMVACAVAGLAVLYSVLGAALVVIQGPDFRINLQSDTNSFASILKLWRCAGRTPLRFLPRMLMAMRYVEVSSWDT